MEHTRVEIANGVILSNDFPLVIIAGPCVIESEQHCIELASKLKKIISDLRFPFIFKASFDKANRSSVDSFRGPGLQKGLKILAKVKEKLNIPILTDIHEPVQAQEVAKVADMLQIPAFLSRQTDLIKAASQTQKPINIKKGQFLAPEDMRHVIKKAETFGNKKISLTERGSSFGYHNLVVDFRGIEIMKSFSYPVIFDATHSVQLPSGKENSSGGQSEFIYPLSRAAAAVGVAALFLETHDNPSQALSDGPNSLDLETLAMMLKEIKKIDEAVK
ncbi:MAG: 3-deoxy-8-phosphooctulonate synthase [Elusimicrobiota bacterium]|jgi:2-dehydro-3-deoxyphosphooctonate aldolase (KDO 8-P synthase)|nr:3-deoxy-8-phosphooctulonate synthase [Elusimicrobiota bacterium]